MGEPTVGAAELMDARVVQLASDLLGPLDGLRVLDLACLEGLYGLELAMHGASVVATEGREVNAERVRFAAERLRPQDFRLEIADVRDLSPETTGTFDLVLCLGILYHLGAEDAVRLAQAVADCTERVAFFRTAVGLSDSASFSGYRGFDYPEPETAWSSMGNRTSFWPTRASLLNLLLDVGFTSVMEVVGPPVLEIDGAPDGTFLVAMKGNPVEVRAAPPKAATELRGERWPERTSFEPHPAQRRGWQSKKRYWQRKTRRA